MDLHLIWALAETGYGFGAIAAAAMAWSIWRRTPHTRDTATLCASLIALGLHYGAFAVDASVRTSGTAERGLTVWTAWGQLSVVVSGILFVLALFVMVRRACRPAGPTRWLAGAVLAPLGLAGVLVLWSGGHLAWGLLTESPSSVVDTSVDRIVGRSLASVLCFIGTLSVLGLLVEQRSAQGHAQWRRWLTEGERWQTVTRPGTAAATPVSVTAATRRFRLASLVFVWASFVLSAQGMNGTEGWTPLSLSGAVLLRLLLLPGLLAILYYQARFLFFDVLIKQGVIWGAVAILVTAAGFTGTALMWPLEARPVVAIVCVIATMIVVLTVSLIERGNRWLDQRLFRRPNYRAALTTITPAMAQAPDRGALIATMTTRLRDTLGVAFVHYGAQPTHDGEVVIGLGRADRPRGYLTLGPRPRRQPYGSEDLTFIDAVAAQFAGQLEAAEAQEARQLATIADLRALRAQINPHFLFNALNTIAEMARAQPATEAALLNLSRVLRYALESTQREQVPLRDELDAIQAYLQIEAERFDHQVAFHLDVPEELLEVPVPPMLLQPLIENAVRHGLAGRASGGVIRVVASRVDGRLWITVHDNGVGFDLQATPRHVGLDNVGARVERTGGWWRVQSAPGRGTEITVALVTS